MTVKELIKELEPYRSNLIVVANDGSDEGYTCPVDKVELYPKRDRDGKLVNYVKIHASGWPV